MENATERMTVNNEKLERDPVKTVILASMMGTAIEFFDFYAYGTASAAYFPKVFFPQMTPLLATLLSLLTFGVAFVARPVGSFVFGHFGDRLGRKKTLVVSLLVMGLPRWRSALFPAIKASGLAARCCFAFAALFKESAWAANGPVPFWLLRKTRRLTNGHFMELSLKSEHQSVSLSAMVCSMSWKKC